MPTGALTPEFPTALRNGYGMRAGDRACYNAVTNNDVGTALTDHVCLYNDPHSELDRHYRFERARNIVGDDYMHCVNIDPSMDHGLMEHPFFDAPPRELPAWYPGAQGINFLTTDPSCPSG
ncbi:MAG: hypothetical protein K9N23_23555 [Akkermansiaceae bacterium]|nr:hypothetical protein [Akkermansiaceae bacterium]